jgi:hypothetical protein
VKTRRIIILAAPLAIASLLSGTARPTVAAVSMQASPTTAPPSPATVAPSQTTVPPANGSTNAAAAPAPPDPNNQGPYRDYGPFVSVDIFIRQIAQSLIKANPLTIDGGTASVDTEQAAHFVFPATAGQTIRIQSNRNWILEGPLGDQTVNQRQAITLKDSGRYLLRLDAGLTPPAIASVSSVDPTGIITTVKVGESIAFSSAEIRQQEGRIALLGGQRYKLIVPSGQSGGTFCVVDLNLARPRTLACASGGLTDGVAIFVPHRDQTYALQGSFPSLPDDAQIPSISARVEIADNDVVLDTTTNPLVNAQPRVGQSVVIPFWGSAAERVVLSSPDAANVTPWGQPWIDREGPALTNSQANPQATSAADGGVKVFAVPLSFDPSLAPFIAWPGTNTASSKKRFGVYRGEDTAVNVPTTGEPVVIRNKPWFASVASLQFEPGDRYIVQVTGTNFRPTTLAIRDPSGKFSSSLSPWQWTEVDGNQRAISSVSANKPGRWALEIRPSGNAIHDVSVSVAKVGGNGSYEGVVEVGEVLNVGDATDVQLGPNEFASMTMKLNSATPQIIQPEVLRYRNKTFQKTAADMSIWDSRGRLVWSNNRSVIEEVLSGRLGSEGQSAERFLPLASTEPYRLIIDPLEDLAGRFRVSVSSTPVTSDVAIGNGTIPQLLGGTKTGVLEVRKPTRYRLTGTEACLIATSLSEWQRTRLCVKDGETITLAPGVHRLAFGNLVQSNASFAPVAANTPPDPIQAIETSIGGPPARISPGTDDVIVRFNVPKAGTRIVLQSNQVLSGGLLVRPDGIRESTYGVFVAPLAGQYEFWTSETAEFRNIAVLPAVSEVQSATLVYGAKFELFRLVWGQRLEAKVVLKKRSTVFVETFDSEERSNGPFRFLYAADSFERRFGGDQLTLDPGTYRFVFVGNSLGRITLRKTPTPPS